MESQGAGLEELTPLLSGIRGKHQLETGEVDYGLQACGQVVGLVRDIPSVREVIDGIVSGAKEIVGRLGILTAER